MNDEIGKEILAALRALPAAIAEALAANSGEALSRDDRAAMATLLPAIAGAGGSSRDWTAGELLARARLGDAAAIVLRSAIERATGDLDGLGTAKKLGKLFARADGLGIGDLRLERIGRVREGTLWTIRAFEMRGNLTNARQRSRRASESWPNEHGDDSNGGRHG